MVTANVYTRVLMVRVGDHQGTAFTLEVDRRQYLLTASHVVAPLDESGSIQIFRAGKWSRVDVRVFRGQDPIDIAVLVPHAQLTRALPFKPSITGMILGQDAYFLGFPFGLSIPVEMTNGLYPFALVKRGTLSAIVKKDGITKILLDGYNNFGFSGGPIVYRRHGESKIVLYLAGVISGFHPEFVHVTKPVPIEPKEDYIGIEPWRILRQEDGRVSELKDTEERVPLNTGIVVGYGIDHALDLIRQHPIGPEVKE